MTPATPERPRRRLRWFAVLAPIIAVGGITVGIAIAQTPEGTTAEFTYAPAEAPQGGQVQIDAVCRFGQGPADRVLVYAFLVAGQAGTPYDFAMSFDIDATGAASGLLMVPADAPPGDYMILGTCFAADQAFGEPQNQPFRVLPGVAPPTTTAPTTIVPPTPPTTPPALPVPGVPTFTG